MGVAYGVVGERNAKDVGEEEEDFVLGVVDGGRGDIAVDAGDLLNLACADPSACTVRTRSSVRTLGGALVADAYRVKSATWEPRRHSRTHQ